MDREFAQRLGSTRASPTSSPQRHRGGRSSRHGSPRKSGVREGDRFIPHPSSVARNAERPLLHSPSGSPRRAAQQQRQDASPETGGSGGLRGLLVQNELLGADIRRMPDPAASNTQSSRSPQPAPLSPPRSSSKRVLSFSAPSPHTHPKDDAYSLSPVGRSSRRLLSSPRRAQRPIPKTPFKVLDAPDLVDDFYLNLLDWSATNTVAVGLDSNVYLWSALTSQVTRLCDVAEAMSRPRNTVTSVSWSKNGAHLAVGTAEGLLQIWDVARSEVVAQYEHTHSRVGSLAWSSSTLAAGSRDRAIRLYDRRQPEAATPSLVGHRQEVCGLQWSPEESTLASGGNDNKLLVWDVRALGVAHRFTQHKAAVKAVAWSPHQHGLLASGGGTADQTIRFWNTLTGQPLQTVQTESQVCNIAWSRTSNELVSTHGYSQNQIIVWKYPSMTRLGVLVGHTQRVLYLALSPDNQTIVTGAGDETLRFWHVFSKGTAGKDTRSPLSVMAQIR
ncbi:Fzr1 protein [Salpingoeca rosetta]|uniref:Fzr1 protein n=1 Tax=Salpingoeca rosetta (strain ATCC 50818 / BSB-021) TaxID=946362 RepID=F2UI04_SALR5|nr:Fzr1 protein [Salpingoeca rosetta]EGD76753.1 Fzr1 protein [Salpingoeca rosetta]|eukprot:XP_004991125.1 Fzr1 protein [Salpingoeca rosetta]